MPVGAFFLLYKSNAHLARRYPSPFSGHSVEVWVDWEWSTTPGNTYSGSGYVLLKNQEGIVLQRKETDLVISIDPPVWQKDRVEIKLFADWPLD